MVGESLIIGAGPAGMACAMELHKKNKRFVVLEKDAHVGGLSKTYQFGEFKTDNGPHRFFSQNKYLYEFIESLIKEKWIKVRRITRFYVNGKFYKYPVEIKDALKKMGFLEALKIMRDYLLAKMVHKKEIYDNFEEYAIATFGKTLAELNFLNYTEKIWGLPCSEISVDWADQRIKGLNVKSLIKKAFNGKSSGPKTLVDEFYYPSEGTGLIYETIKNKIEKKNKIMNSDEPVKILIKKNRISEVHLKSGKKLKPENVVSSMPITRLVEILNPRANDEVLNAVKNLRFRSQVYLFLTINKPRITRDQWIYFPDKEIPFGRISEMKNFSDKMSPKNKTSLFIEFFCWENDKIWNMNKEELFSLAIPWLEKLGLVKRSEVINFYQIKKNFVYPVYDLDYKKNIKIIKEYLDKIENLICVGRPGRFKYTNQDHSLEMGILAAKSIVDGKRYNVEDVGSQKEYFEKGYVK